MGKKIHFSYIRSLMREIRYISVILPLKLEWEPCYSLPQDEGNTDMDTHGIVKGDRVKVTFAGKDYIGVVSDTDITPETDIRKIHTIKSIERDMDKIFPEEIDFWRQVADYYLCTVGEVYKAAYPTGKLQLEETKAKSDRRAKERIERLREAKAAKIEKLKARLEKKSVQIENARKEATRQLYQEQANAIQQEIAQAQKELADLKYEANSITSGAYSEKAPDLTDAQKDAYDEALLSFQADKPVLLHGVTGSGKTEIYTRLAQRAIENGRNVLYLVPEIALSRQLEERLFGYFGESLMIFHSSKTAAEKREVAENIRKSADKEHGHNYVILGTRSSLFLPHHDLGLIIIDEEHDNSYKQDAPAPRYNGRDTALMLAKIHNADVILGSATPSLESLYNTKAGKFGYVRLEERFHGADGAEIEIIDTKAERLKRGMRGNFSIKLIQQIEKTLNAGEQILILRSRRAYSPALQCRDCGELVKCPHCNVSLSLHRPSGSASGRLMCHHCGWHGPASDRCGACNGELMLLGAGTQKIEEEAAALFPNARIARLDSDTAQNKTYEVKTIQDFSNGEIDILIGTQIISKGFDFSNLSLVVIIAADTMLALQDFRADEKAIQLLEQLRGRCGRRERKGLFIIQTSQPQHPLYQRLLCNKAGEYCMELMDERRDFGFPPFSRIVTLTIKDRFEDRAQRMSTGLAKVLSAAVPGVTGPYTPNPDKKADNYIRHIRISLKKDRNLYTYKKAIRNLTAGFETKEKYAGHITIDVDPA